MTWYGGAAARIARFSRSPGTLDCSELLRSSESRGCSHAGFSWLAKSGLQDVLCLVGRHWLLKQDEGVTPQPRLRLEVFHFEANRREIDSVATSLPRQQLTVSDQVGQHGLMGAQAFFAAALQELFILEVPEHPAWLNPSHGFGGQRRFG